jgi:hypothetical protein
MLPQTKILPPPDALESNDDAGRAAHPFGTMPRTQIATLDWWDDPVDVYSIHLNKGTELYARLGRGSTTQNTLLLWRPGTTTINGSKAQMEGERAARSIMVSGQQRLSFVAGVTGVYYLEVKAGGPTRGADVYALSVAQRKPQA